MVPTTQPEDIAAYAQRVADTWKIGRREVGDGLLVVVAKNDRARAHRGGQGARRRDPRPGRAPAIIDRRHRARPSAPATTPAGLIAAVDQLDRAHPAGEAPAGARADARQRAAARAPAASTGRIWRSSSSSACRWSAPCSRGIFGRKLGSLLTGGVAGGLGWWLTRERCCVAGGAGLVALVLVGVLGIGSGGAAAAARGGLARRPDSAAGRRRRRWRRRLRRRWRRRLLLGRRRRLRRRRRLGGLVMRGPWTRVTLRMLRAPLARRNRRAPRRSAPPRWQRLRGACRRQRTRHSGEIRLCIEAGLPLCYLWRDATRARARDRDVRQAARVGHRAQQRRADLPAAGRARDRDRRRPRCRSPSHVPQGLGHARRHDARGVSRRAFRSRTGRRRSTRSVQLLRRAYPLEAGVRNPNELPDAPVIV